MSLSTEDDESTVTGSSSMPPAAPSSAMSLSKPTPHPTTLVIEPKPTDDDDLASDWTFPPMTTPWTGPPDCTWTYDANHVSMSGIGGLEAMLDLQPIAGAKSLSCYPDAMFDNGLTGVYSPGTCPHGWTTVTLRIEPSANRDDETTTAICCSSHYTLEGSLCKRSTSSVVAIPYTFNQTAQSYDAHSESATTLYSATIAVYTIRALFKDRDKDALGLKDEDDIPGVDHHKDSLSLSERIGIGVGVAVFVLLAVGGLAFWLIHREKARTEKRRPHELNAVGNMRHNSSGAGDDFYAAAEANQRNRSRGNAEPPPPAYVATDSNSMTENDSRLSEDTTTRDEEIRALQIQKEAIQRRLQQLEQADIQNQTDNRHN
ncbi:hypothetical protein NXS19_000482 [Fusarium pseudograminearum]|uniref:Uncharacterized protein n=1 Tax=Fusarium pseudograminearum (strain CS3096) TaxID=1028729 RepID=K3VWX2_FUSPC|nr:hypothetical protein FPSE_00058 [Fusarium pseudograminearum CS3096]EKJ79778.1 hypothetical protein FPSE_00058 [Fusarium pseudograminearum CS3096]KAF0639878.1 hypothetical protein FPSE5266_00058 [Fusarium pseudograminearum]UZP32666.1 hypothetical protein NXS19_000482 [Fusarium pseudograminearum]